MTKHSRVIWLALAMALTVVGYSAMAASSASAGTYYWCVAKKKGEYTGSTCATKAKPKKGKFELEPITSCVATKKGEYTNASCTTLAKPKKGKYDQVSGPHFTVSTGEAVLSTPDLGSGAVKCKASTGEGEITGAKTSVERATFSGCEFEGLPCESAGPNSTPSGASGVIITNLLDGKLIDHGEKGPSGGEPAVGEVWQELQSSEHEPYQTEFNCAGVVFLRTQGTISGVYTPASVNTLSTSAELLFEDGKGEQDLDSEALGESGWVGPFPSNEQIIGGVAVTTSPAVVVCGAPVEVRSGPRDEGPSMPADEGAACAGLVEVTATKNGAGIVAGLGPSKLTGFTPGPPAEKPESQQWVTFTNNTGEAARFIRAEITIAGETFTTTEKNEPAGKGAPGDYCVGKVSNFPLYRYLFAAGEHCKVWITWGLPEGALVNGEYQLEWRTKLKGPFTTRVELEK
jgi:hypothetical protein